MLRSLDLIVEPDSPPRWSLAADGILLEQAAARGRAGPGVLRLHTWPGDVLALGRWHLAPDPPAGAAVTLWRRRTGGRAIATGSGFLGLSLVLPHRSALAAAEPLALDPPQAMNRCVRGILEGCKGLGVSAFYPGRDLVTVGTRAIGLVSLDVEPSGACLFEAVLAVGRDFSLLPALLDAADPAGVVKAAMLLPDDTTSLARELGRAPALVEVAERIGRGYAERFGVEVVARELSAAERDAIAASARALDEARWVHGRRRRPDLDRRAEISGQLGVVELHFAVADGRLREVLLAGDVIAPAATVERLEERLRGCAREPRAIAAAVEEVLAQEDSWLLGLGPARAAAERLAGALAA